MPGNRKPFIVSKNIKDIVKVESEPSLLDLQRDLICIIGSWLDIKSKGQYVISCKTINNFFQPNLDKEAEPFIEQALHYAAFGMKTELDTLLTQRPGLIYKRGTTLDPCDRIIHGTVYRIALGAKDWNAFPDQPFEEMAEMIERHMKTLPKGEKEIELQTAEQFPKGWEEQERIQEEKQSDALKKVFAAIDQSNNNKECKNAIEEFIKCLQSQNEIKIGYHYNDKLLSEALDLFAAHYKKFGGYDSRKNRLAATKIVGSIQSRMTACLAMAFCDGLGCVIEGKIQFSRSMALKGGTLFFSLGLGLTHFIYSHAAGWTRRAVELTPLIVMAQSCKTYIEQKNQAASKRKIPDFRNQKLLNIPHA